MKSVSGSASSADSELQRWIPGSALLQSSHSPRQRSMTSPGDAAPVNRRFHHRAEADKTNLHSKSTFEPLCSRRSISGLWRKVLTFTGMAATKPAEAGLMIICFS